MLTELTVPALRDLSQKEMIALIQRQFEEVRRLEAARRFGPRLAALVTYLHHEHQLGFERLCGVMRDVFGTFLSEGGTAIIERAGQAAQLEAEAIGERVRQSPVMASDETSARVQGRNYVDAAIHRRHVDADCATGGCHAGQRAAERSRVAVRRRTVGGEGIAVMV